MKIFFYDEIFQKYLYQGRFRNKYWPDLSAEINATSKNYQETKYEELKTTFTKRYESKKRLS